MDDIFPEKCPHCQRKVPKKPGVWKLNVKGNPFLILEYTICSKCSKRIHRGAVPCTCGSMMYKVEWGYKNELWLRCFKCGVQTFITEL